MYPSKFHPHHQNQYYLRLQELRYDIVKCTRINAQTMPMQTQCIKQLKGFNPCPESTTIPMLNREFYEREQTNMYAGRRINSLPPHFILSIQKPTYVTSSSIQHPFGIHACSASLRYQPQHFTLRKRQKLNVKT